MNWFNWNKNRARNNSWLILFKIGFCGSNIALLKALFSYRNILCSTNIQFMIRMSRIVQLVHSFIALRSPFYMHRFILKGLSVVMFCFVYFIYFDPEKWFQLTFKYIVLVLLMNTVDIYPERECERKRFEGLIKFNFDAIVHLIFSSKSSNREWIFFNHHLIGLNWKF